MLGLFLGVSGIAIDGSLKMGVAMQHPLIAVGAAAHASRLAVATVLQVIGLGLVFVRTFRRSDLDSQAMARAASKFLCAQG